MPSKNISSVCYPCGITANYLSCLKKYGKPPLQAAFILSTYHREEMEREEYEQRQSQ